MVSGVHPLPFAALRELLLHRSAQHAQMNYAIHLLWLIGAQLYTLGGGSDYPVPDVFTLFPDPAVPADRRSGADIRQSILTQLLRPSRKEIDHGKAI